MMLKRIIWPMTDSDDEDSNVEETCRVTGFLRTYIETGSSDQLVKLLEFWTSWNVLPQQGDHLYVEVTVDPKKKLPTASTCSTTLTLPLNTCTTYQEFTDDLMTSVKSTIFWFGTV